MLPRLLMAMAVILGLGAAPGSVLAQTLAPNPGSVGSAGATGAVSQTYSSDELLQTGHQFFGSVTHGLASLIEQAVGQYGQPNAYILGQEGSGAILGGLRYGDGIMYTRNAGNHNVFWQGPSLGLNFGANGSRVMMLVYNLPSIEALYDRYPGIDGSLYAIGGLSMTALRNDNVYIVPISSGLGLQAGVSIGYLKFTQEPTWNPF